MAFLTWLILAGVAVFLTVLRLRTRRGLATLKPEEGAQRVSFVVGSVLLLATALGVWLSYLAVNKVFVLTAGTAAGAIGVAVVANLGSYMTQENRTRFDFIQILTFIKDGFLWTSAYPSLAVALGMTALK